MFVDEVKLKVIAEAQPTAPRQFPRGARKEHDRTAAQETVASGFLDCTAGTAALCLLFLAVTTKHCPLTTDQYGHHSLIAR